MSNIDSAFESHNKEHEKIQDILLKYTERGDLVLELGCGSGVDSLFLARNGRIVWALDKSKDAVFVVKKIAEKYNANVNIIQADLRKLPFKEKFDLIFSSAVLHYFEKEKAKSIIKNEWRRVLKTGGFLIFDVPYTYSLHTLYKKFMMRLGDWPWGWETQYTKEELKILVAKSGFEFIDFYSWGLDRISKILFCFHETRQGKKLPRILREIYSEAFTLPRYMIENFFPVNIGVIAKKKS